MNQLENWQARYCLNTWMSQTRTDGPDEFEPSKFDCIYGIFHQNEKGRLLEKKVQQIYKKDGSEDPDEMLYCMV